MLCFLFISSVLQSKIHLVCSWISQALENYREIKCLKKDEESLLSLKLKDEDFQLRLKVRSEGLFEVIYRNTRMKY